MWQRAFPREHPLRTSRSLGCAGRALRLPSAAHGRADVTASLSPAFCHQPARDPHGPGGERGAGAVTRPQSREVQMAARAASHGSSLCQTGEATGDPGRHAGRRMGSRVCRELRAGQWGRLFHRPPRAVPGARTLLCVVCTPGEAPAESHDVGAPGLPPPEHLQPHRALGSWERVRRACPAGPPGWAWRWQPQCRV